MVIHCVRAVCLMILFPFAVVAQKTATPEFIQKEISQGKQYCLVLLKKGTDTHLDSAKLVQMQMQHLQTLFTLKLQGKLPIFGPLTEDIDLRGIGIFNLTDKTEIAKLLDADPYIKSGAMTYEIYNWFSIPGYTLP